MRLMMILTIFIATTITSGCATIPTPPPHPGLILSGAPPLPKLTREMLDCGRHNPETLPLCRRIKEREAILTDHIETQAAEVAAHNEALKQ